MKPALLTISILLAGLYGCYTYTAPSALTSEERQPGPQAELLYELDDFDEIRISGRFRTTVQVGQAAGVVFRGDQSTLDRVVMNVEENQLQIGYDSSFRNPTVIEAEITVPYLSGVHVSGSNRIELFDIDSESFSIRGSGSTRVVASGSTGNLEIRTSGSSRVEANELISNDVTVRTSGSSRIEVHSNGQLDARTSGSSRVIYHGDPTRVQAHTSGSGRVEPASGS